MVRIRLLMLVFCRLNVFGYVVWNILSWFWINMCIGCLIVVISVWVLVIIVLRLVVRLFRLVVLEN